MSSQTEAEKKQSEVIDAERLDALVRRCGEALYNPMFVAIAEAAPSPWKADQYVTRQLGWLNDVGVKMRAAANIHLRFPQEVWANLVPRKFCPAFGMFNFSSHPNLPDNMLCSSAVNFGGQTIEHKPTWPLLLREFLIHVGENDVSTVDHMFRHDAISTVPHGNERRIIGRLFEGRRYQHEVPFGPQAKIGENPFAIQRDHPYDFGFQTGKLNIHGRMVGVVHNDKADMEDFFEDVAFPRFFKILEIQERRTADEGYDRIRICARCDLGPKYAKANRGWLKFERVQPIDVNLEGVFTYQYQVGGGHIQYIIRNPDLIIVRRRSHGEFGHSGFRNLVKGPSSNAWSEKIEPLYNLAREMEERIYYKGNGSMPLEQVLGSHLILTPPERLADMFC